MGMQAGLSQFDFLDHRSVLIHKCATHTTCVTTALIGSKWHLRSIFNLSNIRSILLNKRNLLTIEKIT